MINISALDRNWTPRKLSNLRLWLDASNVSAIKDGSGNPITDGTTVDKWYSQTNERYEFNAQSTVGKRPTWESTGFGTKSKPYIQFNGSSNILRCTAANLLTALNGDSSGSVIIIGSNSNNSSTSTGVTYLGSCDEATSITNLIGFTSRGLSQIFYSAVNSYQAGVYSRVRNSQGVTQGANDEVYMLISSDSSVYGIRTKATVITPVTYTAKTTEAGGSDDGDWFADVINRDNLTLGGIKQTSELYHYCRIAEVIITGTNLIGTTELTYLDTYIQSKYGNLQQQN